MSDEQIPVNPSGAVITEKVKAELEQFDFGATGSDVLDTIEGLIGSKPDVVADTEAEEADFVLCASAQQSHFKDDVFTVCADCRGAIIHRPYAPKKPPKICLSCAEKRVGRKIL